MKKRTAHKQLVLRKNVFTCIILLSLGLTVSAQRAHSTRGKKISPDLFGLFFEDINYAADGGLYAELLQNRSFEYSPAEQREWHPLSFWEYTTPGFSFGSISVETIDPVNKNNPHYIVLNAEHIGREVKHVGPSGIGLKNSGFAGIVVKAGDQYNFSMYAKQLSNKPIKFTVTLENSKGEILASSTLSTASDSWKKYTATLIAKASFDTASLVILATTPGKFALDVVSLFPQKTFKNRPNGLRADLAQLLADMQPAFIRFPGGCLAHGDGLGNMYRWKSTIGPIEERIEQRNIWGYHQTAGLGYFEYFQFCEDIGAKPLPVLPAAVSCQNSGGTWRVGGTGQKALPLTEMQEYIQEVLDLVEWANGPATTAWGSKRAAAGHPEPFHLEYIGIGNEDKITPEFEERFSMIYKAVKAKYPNITIIGTAGPFHSGEDFDKGWKIANTLSVPVVDEHYYTQPGWFISNQYRYDKYNRKQGQVYLGEYASWGNNMQNAIAEAVYMTGLERNGDIVKLSSYAPLFAKKDYTQWKTDMVFFTNTGYYLTPNYYVQKMFSVNKGDIYLDNIITKNNKDSLVAGSCVVDSKSGAIIIKLVNAGKDAQNFDLNLTRLGKFDAIATKTILQGAAESGNSFEGANAVAPASSTITMSKKMHYLAPPMSLTVIRINSGGY